jgi:hypothetical protein
MTDQQQLGVTGTVHLPLELAPSLADRVVNLLAEVHVTVAPALLVEIQADPHRCVVCHQSGKLGGHHDQDGTVRWIHRKCHRHLHRSGRHLVLLPTQRRSRYAC